MEQHRTRPLTHRAQTLEAPHARGQKAESIDKQRAEASLKRAKDRLKSNEGVDSKRAELSLARAMNRLSISQK